MDAESYSLHTFEALLTQSMENIGKTVMRYSNSYTVYAEIKDMTMIWQCIKRLHPGLNLRNQQF
jgi:hypothetical protein